MTPEGSDGLSVNAEVRRGSFLLAVRLTAAPVRYFGLLGPNRAGKSTLLSAVAGLTRSRPGASPSRGRYGTTRMQNAVEAAGQPSVSCSRTTGCSRT